MTEVTLMNLVPRLDTQEFRDLFLFIVFRPTAEKVHRLIEEYRSDPHLRILGVERAQRLVALIGLDLSTPHEGVIRHIVVHPDHRHTGLGRAMITAACDQYGLQVLTAETDRDADGFYRRCGFDVQSLGELYPGTERFCCVLRKGALSELKITIEEAPAPTDLDVVHHGLKMFNESRAGTSNYKPLTLFLRDAENQVVGGLNGSTGRDWLEIDCLWVSEVARGQGYGTQLIQAAEKEAIARGCHHAFVDTFSFQALAFYLKLGYVVFGTLEDFPPGHSRYFLNKLNLESHQALNHEEA